MEELLRMGPCITSLNQPTRSTPSRSGSFLKAAGLESHYFYLRLEALSPAPNSALSQVDLSLECRSHLPLALRKQRSFQSMLESWVYVLGKHLNVRR